MPVGVAMPKIGFSMEQGTVVSWLKTVGEKVEKGEPIVLIQTEKVEYEVEALGSGKLRCILAEPGQDFPPGQLLGVIAQDGEDVDAFVNSYRPETTDATEETSAPPAPAARAAATADVSRPVETRASPRARKTAQEHGVDLTQVSPARPGGRIAEADVRRFLEERKSGVGTPAVARKVPLSPMRRTIAERMLSSSQHTATVALSIPVDFLAAEKLRRQSTPPLSHQDVVMKAVALELRAHPTLNSALQGNELEIYESINLGFAVALEEGLVVPVIREADAKSLADIRDEREQLSERARARKLKAEEMEGGTFTISSLGGYGITVFTPILNPPQTGILGVGAVEEVPVAVGKKTEVRPRLTLTLVFDHRATDGAPAAAFLKAVRERIEQGELS